MIFMRYLSGDEDENEEKGDENEQGVVIEASGFFCSVWAPSAEIRCSKTDNHNDVITTIWATTASGTINPKLDRIAIYVDYM